MLHCHNSQPIFNFFLYTTRLAAPTLIIQLFKQEAEQASSRRTFQCQRHGCPTCRQKTHAPGYNEISSHSPYRETSFFSSPVVDVMLPMAGTPFHNTLILTTDEPCHQKASPVRSVDDVQVTNQHVLSSRPDLDRSQIHVTIGSDWPRLNLQCIARRLVRPRKPNNKNPMKDSSQQIIAIR